jgi:chaperonin GroEL
MKPHPDLLTEAGIKKFLPSFGYNVAKRRYEDLMDSGVIDPKKVVRCALLYSVTQASLILGMNGIVTDIPEPQKT